MIEMRWLVLRKDSTLYDHPSAVYYNEQFRVLQYRETPPHPAFNVHGISALEKAKWEWRDVPIIFPDPENITQPANERHR